jgi:hypothetical protein
MKESAVKWLVNKLNDDFENNDFLISYANEIAQAKEMEKQQQDELAIGFIKWCENKCVFSPSVIHKPTYKKLLEYYIETIKKK